MTTTRAGWKPSHALRNTLIVLGVLVALLVVVRLVLDPVATRLTRGALKKLDGFTATFTDVHVGVLPPSFTITNFKLIEEPAGRWDEPLIFADRAQVGLLWRKLFHRQLVAWARIDGPKFVAARHHEEKTKKAPEVGEQLGNLAPVKMDQLEVADGEVLIAQGKGKNAPQLWIHGLNLTARNLATRKDLMQDEPATLHLRGKVQRTGTLVLDATLDPWTKRPTFTAKSALEKLDARELYKFLAEKTDLKAVKGEINVFVEAKADDGVLKGGVKPVFKEIEIESDSESLGSKLKALLADTAVDILSDDNGGRDAVATIIPIRGTLKDPQAQLVPTIMGVVRNAFVVGLRSGFAGVPPKTAPEKEGVLKQAVQALKKDAGPPEAQPTAQDKDKDNKKGDQGKSEPRRGHKAASNGSRR
jgi:hypothetical protein